MLFGLGVFSKLVCVIKLPLSSILCLVSTKTRRKIRLKLVQHIAIAIDEGVNGFAQCSNKHAGTFGSEKR